MLPPPISPSSSNHTCPQVCCLLSHCVRTNSAAESVFVVCVYVVSGLTTLYWTAHRGLILDGRTKHRVWWWVRPAEGILWLDIWGQGIVVFSMTSARLSFTKSHKNLDWLRTFMLWESSESLTVTRQVDGDPLRCARSLCNCSDQSQLFK